MSDHRSSFAAQPSDAAGSVAPLDRPRPAWRRRHATGLLAAFTVVALLAPESVAYAQIAGIPPRYGLVAAPLTLLAYALIGRSNVLAVGATAATAVLSGATVARLTGDPVRRVELTAALALLTGAILLVTGLLRCGFIVRFLTPAALTGFLSGLATVVIVRQIGVFVHTEPVPGNAFAKVGHVLHDLQHWHLLSLLVGLGTLLALLLLEWWLPRLPNTLVVLALAWVASVTTDLKGQGVAVVGSIPATVPIWHPPDLTLRDLSLLGTGALGLALIVFVMTYSVSTRTAAEDDPPLDANREMVAVGVANFVAGLVGGLSAGGSPSASAAARSAGARSRATAVIAAAVMLTVTAFCTPAFESLPEPALAAVVIAAVRHFLAVPTLRRYLRCDRGSFAVTATALVGVLTFDLLPGLLLAVGLSLALFIGRATRLQISELGRLGGSGTYLALERHPAALRTPGLVIVRPDGELFFANMSRLTDYLDRLPRQRPDTRVILLDLTATFNLSLPEIDALRLVRARLSRRRIDLWFVHLYLAAADAVQRSDLADVPSFNEAQTAIETFLSHASKAPKPQGWT